MKICSKCGRIIGYNSRFQDYVCRNCGNVEKDDNVKRVGSYKIAKAAQCKSTNNNEPVLVGKR